MFAAALKLNAGQIGEVARPWTVGTRGSHGRAAKDAVWRVYGLGATVE